MMPYIWPSLQGGLAVCLKEDATLQARGIFVFCAKLPQINIGLTQMCYKLVRFATETFR